MLELHSNLTGARDDAFGERVANYYMGVHWRPGIMPCTTSSCRTYTALGGSNTCGHGLRLQYNAFQTLIFEGLKKRGRGEFTLQPSCVPAMGPDYPASCLDYFAPNTTDFATLEFTPNMGDAHELDRNQAHLTHMAHSLLRRGGMRRPAEEQRGEKRARAELR